MSARAVGEELLDEALCEGLIPVGMSPKGSNGAGEECEEKEGTDKRHELTTLPLPIFPVLLVEWGRGRRF